MALVSDKYFNDLLIEFRRDLFMWRLYASALSIHSPREPVFWAQANKRGEKALLVKEYRHKDK